MSKDPGVVRPRNCDPSVRQAIQQLTTRIVGLESTPSFASLTLTGVTASRLVSTDSDKAMSSVSNLASWVAGTVNRVTVADDGDGTITLSGPQDIHTGASPTFAGGTFTGVVTGILPVTGDHFTTKEYVDLAIGSQLDFFLSNTDDGVVADTHVMYERETGEAQSTEVTAALAQNPDQLIFAWLSEIGRPEASHAREGVYDMHVHLTKAGTKAVAVYWTLSYVDANGSDNKTLIVTSETSPALTTDETAYDIHAVVTNDTTTGVTKRLLLQVYANVTSSGSPTTVTVTMEGTTDSHLTVDVPSDVWQLRGDVLDDLNILGTVGANSEMLVGTGVGAFAWEAGATLRTSIGVGTGDSPTLTGLTLSGSLSLGFGDLVSEQNPDAVDAIRLKGTVSDVDVVLGVGTGYFSVWNAADDNAVFYVNNVGDTDVARNLTVDGTIINTDFTTLTDNSMADALHRHSELSASDGTPDQAVVVDAIGQMGIGTATPQKDLHIQGTNPTIRMSDSDAATDQTVTTLIEFYRANNTNRVGFLGMESTANNVLKIGTDYAAGQIVLATGSNVNALTIDSSGNITLATVAAEGSDVDKFLVSSSGVVKYRTGTQVLSDIGGQTQGDILDDFNTLTPPASDGQFIVATGAGVFAYEATTVARTSLGVGTGDSPAFAGLTLSGNVLLSKTSADSEIKVTTTGAGNYFASIRVDSDDCALLYGAFDDDYSDVAIYAGQGVIQVSSGDLILAPYFAGGEVEIYTGGRAAAQLRVKITDTAMELGGNLILPDGGTVGQAGGPLLTFNDTSDLLGITGCQVGIGTVSPGALFETFRTNTGTHWRVNRNGTDIIDITASSTSLEYNMLVAPSAIIFNSGSVDCDIRFRWDGGEAMRVDGENGRVGIGVTAPLAMLHVDQSNDAAAIPTLILDQADISEGLINFIASDRGVITGATNSLKSVRVELGGVVYRMALYVDA